MKLTGSFPLDRVAAALGLPEDSTPEAVAAELASIEAAELQVHDAYQAKHNPVAMRRLMVRASSPPTANTTRRMMNAYTQKIEGQPGPQPGTTTPPPPWLVQPPYRGMSGPEVGGDVTVPSVVVDQDGLIDLAKLSHLSPATVIGF